MTDPIIRGRMSFSLTEQAFLDGTKDVTRRLGWKKIEVGDHIIAVRKCMGLKKGEKQVELGRIEVVSAIRVPLNAIDAEDCRREGFPDMAPADFVRLFCETHHGCKPGTFVNRIEFRRIA